MNMLSKINLKHTPVITQLLIRYNRDDTRGVNRIPPLAGSQNKALSLFTLENRPLGPSVYSGSANKPHQGKRPFQAQLYRALI